MKLYNSTVSGNCYKVRLLLAQLGMDYERVEVDVLDRDNRPEDVMRRNPHGRIPVLVLDDGTSLAESNAIIWHLSRGTSFRPSDPFLEAKTLQWLFFEQNAHEVNIAVVRYIVHILGQPGSYPELLKTRRQAGNAALAAMERHLQEHDYFVGDGYTIADIALYGYTHVAPEGGFVLDEYPAVVEWLTRVQDQRGHVPMVEDA